METVQGLSGIIVNLVLPAMALTCFVVGLVFMSRHPRKSKLPSNGTIDDLDAVLEEEFRKVLDEFDRMSDTVLKQTGNNPEQSDFKKRPEEGGSATEKAMVLSALQKLAEQDELFAKTAIFRSGIDSVFELSRRDYAELQRNLTKDLSTIEKFSRVETALRRFAVSRVLHSILVRVKAQ